MKTPLNPNVAEDVLTMITANIIVADSDGGAYTQHDAKQENLSLLYGLLKSDRQNTCAKIVSSIKDKLDGISADISKSNEDGNLMNTSRLEARCGELLWMLKLLKAV